MSMWNWGLVRGGVALARKCKHGLRWFHAPRIRQAMERAQAGLLADASLSPADRELLGRVSLRVHGLDSMYVPGEAEHYLRAGLSAIQCIDEGARRTGWESRVASVLDFPCGFGRVLRFLKARFPQAQFTASELDRRALDFCARTFAATAFPSGCDFDAISFPSRFDLIWCGSLATHLEEPAVAGLLRMFCRHLAPGGMCVFSMHGTTTVRWLTEKTNTYSLSPAGQTQVLQGYRDSGFGYADYPLQRGYGISLATPERMWQLAAAAGPWRQAFFLESGWNTHHDLYGLICPPPTA